MLELPVKPIKVAAFGAKSLVSISEFRNFLRNVETNYDIRISLDNIHNVILVALTWRRCSSAVLHWRNSETIYVELHVMFDGRLSSLLACRVDNVRQTLVR